MKTPVQQLKINHTMPCPNCGSPAERALVSGGQMIRTQCSSCDYLMITCAITGKVIEAYAPGIWSEKLPQSVSLNSAQVTIAESLSSGMTAGWLD